MPRNGRHARRADRCNPHVWKRDRQTSEALEKLGTLRARANSDLVESQGPSPHCHAGRGRQPERSRYPDASLGTGFSLTHGTSPRAGAKFRHDSEHVRAETALARNAASNKYRRCYEVRRTFCWLRRSLRDRGCARLLGCLPRHGGAGRREALVEPSTALRRRWMRGSRGCIAEGLADLRQSVLVEPPLLHAALGSPAIGTELAPADVVVTALVIEHEKPDGVGVALQQGGIEDQQASCRYRDPEILQARIERAADLPASQRTTPYLDAPVTLQGYWRGCLERMAAKHGACQGRGNDADYAAQTHCDGYSPSFPRPPRFPLYAHSICRNCGSSIRAQEAMHLATTTCRCSFTISIEHPAGADFAA